MKPGAFSLVVPECLDDVLAELERRGGDATVIAGGQSLLPLMALRLARPDVVIDIDRLEEPELRSVVVTGDDVTVGALARHATIAAHPALAHPRWALLRRAVGEIGHLPIRLRGTVGGSFAHADPRAEWSVAALALGGFVRTASARGAREVPLDAFFLGPFITALAPGEVVTQVVLDAPTARARTAFREFALRRGDFARLSIAIAVELEDGTVRSPRVAIGGPGPAPQRVESAEAELDGTAIDGADLAPVVEAVADRAAEAEMAGAEDTRHVARGVAERALADLRAA